MVIIDIRYMWSDMDSPELIWNRRQPSRFVVFRRSRRWKKGIGESGFDGMGAGRVDRTGCYQQGLSCVLSTLQRIY